MYLEEQFSTGLRYGQNSYRRYRGTSKTLSLKDEHKVAFKEKMLMVNLRVASVTGIFEDTTTSNSILPRLTPPHRVISICLIFDLFPFRCGLH